MKRTRRGHERVVIGDFGGIARNGLSRALGRQGFEVTVCDLEALEQRLAGADAVVVDLDLESCLALAGRIAIDYPHLRVIACSSEEPRMRVFSSERGRAPSDHRLTPRLLASAVRGEL